MLCPTSSILNHSQQPAGSREHALHGHELVLVRNLASTLHPGCLESRYWARNKEKTKDSLDWANPQRFLNPKPTTALRLVPFSSVIPSETKTRAILIPFVTPPADYGILLTRDGVTVKDYHFAA